MRMKIIVLHSVCWFHSLLGGKRWSKEEKMGKTRLVRHCQRLVGLWGLLQPNPSCDSKEKGSGKQQGTTDCPQHQFWLNMELKSSPSPDSFRTPDLHQIYTGFTPGRIWSCSSQQLSQGWKMLPGKIPSPKCSSRFPSPGQISRNSLKEQKIPEL